MLRCLHEYLTEYSRKMVLVRRFIGFFMGILMLSCADDVQNVYSKYRAAFTYNKVTTTAPLYKALTGAGIFCSIYCQGGKIYFNTPYESKYETLTDINMYMKPIAFNGFIVGLSNLPEMGTTDLPLLCYDRVCPNCFEESISPSLTLQENGFAYCNRCKRKYDLNNLGVISEGEKGLKLIRYHIMYDGADHLRIYNP